MATATHLSTTLAELGYVESDKGQKTHKKMGLPSRAAWRVMLQGRHPKSNGTGAVRPFPPPISGSLQAVLGRLEGKAMQRVARAIAEDLFAFVDDWLDLDRQLVFWAGIRALGSSRCKAIQFHQASKRKTS